MAISVTLPKHGEGFQAELTVGDHVHLVLRAYLTGVGPVWSIRNVKTGEWVDEPDYAGDIDSAKEKGEAVAKAIARHLLKRASSKEEVPEIVWQPL
jgi:hypothetical protein